MTTQPFNPKLPPTATNVAGRVFLYCARDHTRDNAKMEMTRRRRKP